MRVLGIDPGTFKMGVGIIEYINGEFNLVYSGVLKASRNMPIHQRLDLLHKKLLEISIKYKPIEITVKYIIPRTSFRLKEFGFIN